MSKREMISALSQYDGSNVSILSETQAQLRHSKTYWEDLIGLSGSSCEQISNGATWILKAELTGGSVLQESLIENLIENLAKITSWQAVLHLCQTFDYIKITEKQASHIVDWAQKYHDHPRPFVRAWSLHVVFQIGQIFQAYSKEGLLALEKAENDKAGSVKARARQLRKQISSTLQERTRY